MKTLLESEDLQAIADKVVAMILPHMYQTQEQDFDILTWQKQGTDISMGV
jgi:hypothetical protein